MLSYVMSEYYIAEGANAQACSFGGNGTVNSKAPSSAGSANSVATSCLASATGTSVPTIPGTPSSTGTSSGSGSGGGSSSSNAASVLADAKTLMGMGVLVAAGIASGFWTLA